MEEIRVKDIKIRAKGASKKVSQSKICSEANEILDELRDYKDGKVKLRSLDEFLKNL